MQIASDRSAPHCLCLRAYLTSLPPTHLFSTYGHLQALHIHMHENLSVTPANKGKLLLNSLAHVAVPLLEITECHPLWLIFTI